MDAHDGDIKITNLTDDDSVTGTRFSVHIPLDLSTPEMRRRELISEEELLE